MKKTMKKKGMLQILLNPIVLWILGIYLAIGLIIFVLVGLSGWWSIEHLVLWPKLVYYICQF